MFKILLVSPDKNALSNLASAFAEHDDVDLLWAGSGEKALGIVSDITVYLIVTEDKLGDMTGLEFSGQLLSVNPVINCACVSRLSAEKFHEVSEGLGLMAKLPVQPGKEHAQELLQRLKYIKSLTTDLRDFST